MRFFLSSRAFREGSCFLIPRAALALGTYAKAFSGGRSLAPPLRFGAQGWRRTQRQHAVEQWRAYNKTQ